MLFVGVDWAERHHDLCLLDEQGAVLAKRRITDGLGGVTELHALLARHAEDPSQVVVGIETDRGLLVGALLAAGYQVYGINPLAVSRYRDRHSVSGAKSDRGTPSCWPIWCVPTATTTGRSPAIASSPRRSRCWPAPTSGWCGPVRTR